MFREMRRFRQQLSTEETIAILVKGSNGTLALHGDDDYPYAIPISYVYHQGKLYFHSAQVGHKIDAIKRNPKASFCVIDVDDVKPTKFTTLFRSAILFGTINIITDLDQKKEAIYSLAEKYAPGLGVKTDEEVDRSFNYFCILEFNIEHMTGKAAKELVMQELY